MLKFIISEEAKKHLKLLYKGQTIRIFPKVKTWSGITYDLVLDELKKQQDLLYEVDDLFFIISKEEEKDVSYIEIDYEDDWSGENIIITAGF